MNVKTTDFDSNCWQAQDAAPMTRTEWQNSQWGLPRSEKRTAKRYCKCVLVAAGDSSVQVAASGQEFSDVSR